MCPHAGTSRFHLAEEAESPSESFVQDLIRGLGSSPKTLPCHWFYDEIGSQLFEEICELPEYYLTRCERSILEKRATEIAGVFEEPLVALCQVRRPHRFSVPGTEQETGFLPFVAGGPSALVTVGNESPHGVANSWREVQGAAAVPGLGCGHA